jgi:hypothetical protein
VTDVKRRGRYSRGMRIQFFVRQVAAPAFDIFFCHFQSMQHCTLHRWDFGQSASQPWFLQFVH